MRRKAVFGDASDIDDLKDIDDNDDDDVEDDGRDGSASSYSESSEDDDNDRIRADLEMGNVSKWKESLGERTASRQCVNLMQLVYGKVAKTSTASVNGTVDEESDDEFFKPKVLILEDLDVVSMKCRRRIKVCH